MYITVSLSDQITLFETFFWVLYIFPDNKSLHLSILKTDN